MEKKIILSGYKENEDGSFQHHVESVSIGELGGFKFDRNKSVLGDHFLFVLSTKNLFGHISTIKIYITENDYQDLQNVLPN